MPKRYSDREVSLILQLAVEAEAGVTDDGAPESGLSLREIREIAQEAGIDVARVENAAAGLAHAFEPPTNPLVGVPSTVQFEGVVQGLEVPHLARHEVLDVIRDVLGRQGVVEEEIDSITWKARDASGGRYVSLTPAEDGVRLRVLGNYRDALLGLFVAVGTAAFGLSSVVLEALGVGSAAAIVLAAVGGLTVARAAYRAWRRGEDRRMATVHTKLLAALRRWREQGTAAPGPLPLTGRAPGEAIEGVGP